MRQPTLYRGLLSIGTFDVQRTKNGMSKYTLTTGIAVYTLLLVYAAMLYQERMIFSDMAFQTFQILRNGSVQVQSGRYGAVGTQVFPWLAQEFGFSLKGVLMSYSLGHVLYYFALFLWVMLALRQWRWGLVMLLSSVLLTTHTFYWLSEAPQGLAFLLALLAWMDTKASVREVRWWQWPLWAAGVVTAMYFHPMVLYAMVFCSIFLLLDASPSKRWIWITGLLLLGATFLVKYKILPLDWYDAMSMSRVSAFKEQWPHWLDIQSNRDFLKWCIRDYYFFPVLWLLNAGWYLFKRQWLTGLWVSGFPLAYILLVNVPFHAGDLQFYLENLYLPLGVMVALPAVWSHFSMEEGASPGKFIPAVVLLVVAIRLLHIWHAHEPWTARLQWEKTFLAQHPQPKTLVKESSLPKSLLQFTWGIPYESLLLTALPHPDSARLVFQTPDESPVIDSLARDSQLFLGTFKHYRIDQLPQRYFRPNVEVGYVPGLK